ncbi:MAG: SRPBCC domain-containing protein [Spirosomataceae bacterium]
MQKDYSTVIEVKATSNEVYTAINNVPLWWTENFEGASKKVNDEFTVTFGETFIKLKVGELVNNYKVVWEVVDCFKHFLKNKKEWVGTKICFDIVNDNNEKAKLTFTHFGLSSPLECYEVCCDAWNGYLQGSLKSLFTTGKGTPDKKV